MINESDILNLMTVQDVVSYFHEDDLLEEMGYDPMYCYEDKEAFILEAQYELDREPEIHCETMNEKDIYHRFIDIFSKDKLTYQEWDEFLSKYE